MKSHCFTFGDTEERLYILHIHGTFYGDGTPVDLSMGLLALVCPALLTIPCLILYPPGSLFYMDCTPAPSNSHWELDVDYKGLRQEDDMEGSRASPLPPDFSASSRNFSLH